MIQKLFLSNNKLKSLLNDFCYGLFMLLSYFCKLNFSFDTDIFYKFIPCKQYLQLSCQSASSLYLQSVLLSLMIYGTSVLGPKRKTADKLVNFESGIESQGNARKPIAVKYFLGCDFVCFV